MGMTRLPCPFCGQIPEIYPSNPLIEGDSWGEVRCINKHCLVNPRVHDHVTINDGRGSDAYKEAAIQLWNKRVKG